MVRFGTILVIGGILSLIFLSQTPTGKNAINVLKIQKDIFKPKVLGLKDKTKRGIDNINKKLSDASGGENVAA